MLVKFTVSNYLSFRDEMEFNMLTSPEAKYRRLKHHVTETNGLELLRGAAVYGANASGKSNLVKALQHLKWSISTGLNLLMDNHKFLLDDANQNLPIVMKVEFISQGRLFEYGIISETRDALKEEWLNEIFLPSEKIELIFKRTKKGKQIYEYDFHAKYKTDKTAIDRNNLLVNELIQPSYTSLDVLKDRHYPEIDIAYKWFESLKIISVDSHQNVLKDILSEPAVMSFMRDNMGKTDTGLLDFELETYGLENYFGKTNPGKIEEVKKSLDKGNKFAIVESDYYDKIAILENGKPVVKQLFTRQKGKHKSVQFELENQSHGTRRMIELMPLFYYLIHEPVVVVIDEIDNSIHPNMLKELVRKFMDTPHAKGQLIFTTHETQLLDLDIFRQDEIWFTEKDKEGVSHMYPLSEFNPRYDYDIRRGYLNGRFGAIPFLGSLEDLSWDKYAEA